MAEKFDPRTSLPAPSVYAVRIGYHVGDLVTCRGQAMLVSALVDFSVALYPGEVMGRCYILCRNDWASGVYIIVPVDEIDHPRFYAA